jgi:hypothetical protein
LYIIHVSKRNLCPQELEKELLKTRCLEAEVERLTSQKQELEHTLLQHSAVPARAGYSDAPRHSNDVSILQPSALSPPRAGYSDVPRHSSDVSFLQHSALSSSPRGGYPDPAFVSREVSMAHPGLSASEFFPLDCGAESGHVGTLFGPFSGH